jgi:hypothetical protein
MRRFKTSRIIVAIVVVVLVGVLISVTLIGQASLDNYVYQDLLNYTPKQAGNEKASANSDNPLQGVTKVSVIIDSTPLEKIALPEEKLKNEVVSRLRSGGMTVLDSKDSETDGQIPVLKISVFFTLCGPRFYSSVILFEFKEKVTTNRLPALNIEATTWLRWVYSDFEDFPTERIPERLLQSLKVGVEGFLVNTRSTN